MKNFNLTSEKIRDLRQAHRAEKNRNAAYKINAVILLGSGWSLKEVKQALFLDEETLRSYINNYRTGGIKALIKTNYQGRAGYLSDEQKGQLCQELESQIYLTTSAIIEYTKRTFDVTYTNVGMRDLLHGMGYEFKKPKLVPGNPDRKLQEEFVAHYEAYMREKLANTEVFLPMQCILSTILWRLMVG